MCRRPVEKSAENGLQIQGRNWPLLDHLIGLCKQPGRQGQAQCFCRPQVDHQLEHGWQLDRQVCRRSSTQDLCNEVSDAAIRDAQVRPTLLLVTRETKKALDGRMSSYGRMEGVKIELVVQGAAAEELHSEQHAGKDRIRTLA